VQSIAERNKQSSQKQLNPFHTRSQTTDNITMGCQHSTPAPTESDYGVDHPRPPTLLCKAVKPVPPGSTFNFAIPMKCWSDKAKIAQTDLQLVPMDEVASDNGVGLVLQDALSQSLAVMITDDPKKLIIQICSYTKAFEGQKGIVEHQGRMLYPWAVVQPIRNSNQYEMKAQDGTYFRTDLYGPVGSSRPVKVIVKRDGLFCADVQEERGQLKQWKCKVGPGVDPALLLCFVACYDKLRQLKDDELRAASYVSSTTISTVM